MRRRFVSTEDRDNIIRLRKSGAAWLRIEEMTGIPRRTAKGVYDNWQKNQAADDILYARRQVAAGAFDSHMRDLILMALEITTSLAVPALIDKRSGSQVLDNVFEKDIRGNTKDRPSFSFVKRDAATMVRQNHILFDSLKQHTQGKVDWNLLESWMAARNDWNSKRDLLEVEAGKKVRDMVNKHSNGAVGAGLRQSGMDNKIIQGILEATHHALVDNESQVEKYINPRHLKNDSFIVFSGDLSETKIMIEDINIAVIITVFCRDIVKALLTDKKATAIDDMTVSLARMREANGVLMDKLDELRLTPIILQTKCDICPA